MAKKENLVSNKQKVHLDKSTAIFFSHLVRDGLAIFKEDPTLDEDQILAQIVETDKGQQLVVSAQHSAAFCFVET
jgi:hypothetical protein